MKYIDVRVCVCACMRVLQISIIMLGHSLIEENITSTFLNITFLNTNIHMILIMTKVWNNYLPLLRNGQKLIAGRNQ